MFWCRLYDRPKKVNKREGSRKEHECSHCIGWGIKKVNEAAVGSILSTVHEQVIIYWRQYDKPFTLKK